MLATLGSSNYIISKNKLKEAKKKLIEGNLEDKKELLFLNAFINNEDIVGELLITPTDFASNFKNDYKVFIDDYYDYLIHIFEFYDKCFNDDERQIYETLVKNYEEVFASVHDFFKDLNPDWFNIFNKLYKERHQCMSLTKDRSYSINFPKSDLWIANIEVAGTIEDYANLTHEFAHGIDDKMNGKVRVYTPRNIFIELFPIVCELLFLKDNKWLNNQIELNKYLNNLDILMSEYAEELKVRYNLLSSFPGVTSSKNLARLVRKNWKQNITRTEVNKIYSSPVTSNFHYVFPYIIAKELVNIYFIDKDLFIYMMNQILTSKVDPMETIKKLNITPNGIIK